MKIGILGAGTWGTALSLLLLQKGHDVTLWSALSEEIDQLQKKQKCIKIYRGSRCRKHSNTPNNWKLRVKGKK